MGIYTEVVKRLKEFGIEAKEKQFRPGMNDIVNELLDIVENTTTNTTITTKDTTKIEKPMILSPTEEKILNFIKEGPKRWKDIRDEFNLSDGSTHNYLKLLQEKGLIQKKVFSKKNVVYY